MTRIHRALFALTALLYIFPAFLLNAQTITPSAGVPAYTQIVIFGDSLCDTGNDATISAALYTVNAQVPGPATGYNNGRFTDGTDTVPAAHNYNGVWIEQLAALLSAKPTIKNSLAGGANYAYGFATTDVGTSAFTYGPGNALSFNVSNMGLQLSTWLGTKPVFTPATTLFVVWGGANDLIAATTSAQITAAAQRDANLVQQLITAGATDFIVPNLPPLGLVPRYNGSAATAAQVTGAAAGFNQALAAYLAALPAANPTKTLHIYSLDTYTFFNTVVAAPANKGLVNVIASAQGNSTINPDTFLFWDDLHPTTYGHNLLATTALTLLGTPVTTTTTIAGSTNSPATGAPITFTATIVGASGSPMGNVTFTDFTNNNAVLGTAVPTGTATTTTATFTTTSLAIGTHYIMATFGGVNGYISSSSSTTPIIVANPGATGAALFSVLSVGAGSSVTDTINVGSVGGFNGTVNFACGTLPAHFSCSFAPSSTSVTSNGSGSATTLTIGTSAAASNIIPARPGSAKSPEAIFALFFVPFLGLLGTKRRRLAALALITLTALGTLGLTGCAGAAAATPKAAAGTYAVPVLVTTTSSTQTINLSVSVF